MVRIGSIFFILIFFSSCHRWLVPDNTSTKPMAVFQTAWTEINDNYSFFPEKKVDWKAVYNEFKPKINDSLSNAELFDILNEMLGRLNDGHVNLFTSVDKGRNWSFQENYPNNFNKNFVEKRYLKNNYSITGPLIHNWIDSVGYIYYGSFSSPIADYQMGFTLLQYEKAKGIILDIRDNGGGSTQQILNILGRFIKTKTWIGCNQIRNGRNSFGNEIDIYATPKGRLQIIDKPIIVLTNRRCYSAASFFPAFMSTLPQVTIVGDTTGGGAGMPISYELPNGWTIRYSVTKTYNAEGIMFEQGFPPDIFVQTGPEDELKNKDAIIERALLEIEKQKNKFKKK